MRPSIELILGAIVIGILFVWFMQRTFTLDELSDYGAYRVACAGWGDVEVPSGRPVTRDGYWVNAGQDRQLYDGIDTVIPVMDNAYLIVKDEHFYIYDREQVESHPLPTVFRTVRILEVAPLPRGMLACNVLTAQRKKQVILYELASGRTSTFAEALEARAQFGAKPYALLKSDYTIEIRSGKATTRVANIGKYTHIARDAVGTLAWDYDPVAGLIAYAAFNRLILQHPDGTVVARLPVQRNRTWRTLQMQPRLRQVWAIDQAGTIAEAAHQTRIIGVDYDGTLLGTVAYTDPSAHRPIIDFTAASRDVKHTAFTQLK